MRGNRWKALALCGPGLAWGQWAHPGCGDVTNASFRYENLVQRGQPSDPGLDEPLKMAFDMDAAGKVDVYYVERKGKAKVFEAATGKARTIAAFDVDGAVGVHEQGLLGIALDPGFKSNRRIYFYYNPKAPLAYRVSRFALGSDGMVDMASEKILMEWPHEKGGCCHTGGAMAFDAYGDLWIATGGNGSNRGGPIDETNAAYSEEDAASNTADYRGGILRIHPDDSPRGYSIPAGNFGAFFAARAGDPATAAQYRDTSLVRPEIYVKGARNPYTLTLDPVRRWALTGDVGPDNGAQMEEHNLYKAPAFSGWPYFAGKNLAYQGGKIASAPSNTSKWNRGITTLPPAAPALRSYGTSSAITGPLYRYDGDLQSAEKLPPHFQRKWFIADFKANWIRVATLSENGESIMKDEPIFQNHSWSNPIAIEQGPDGALYVINYAGYFNATAQTSIVRIAYAGDCRPPLPKLERPEGAPIRAYARSRRGTGTETATVARDRRLSLRPGTRSVSVFTLGGRRVFAGAAPRDRAWMELPASVAGGVYRVRMETAEADR